MSEPDRPPSDAGTRGQHLAVGVLATGFVALGIFTLWHFLGALAWAAILAIALWPLYRQASERWGRRTLLAAAFTACVALVFVVPLGLVSA